MDAFSLIPASILTAALLPRAIRRLRLSRAKHRSIGGHSKWSRRLAGFIRFFEYEGDDFFRSDGAPPEVASRRREALDGLALQFRRSSPAVSAFNATLERSVPDVDFTASYRVPFPYRNGIPKELRHGSVVDEARGMQVRDIDGNWRFDLWGSYGVNVFGNEFYKECMADGAARVAALGPVLGSYHPLIRDNVERLKTVSGLHEVSFHMSGTEAVMQAVRLARYHTRRTHLVRFCGSYHGWWDGVQPGVGNRRRVSDVYTLADLSDRTLRVLETRTDIACVLVNPAQALHPNSDAPGDSSLVCSDRKAGFDRERYAAWLGQVREVCRRRGIVLIFDEVFSGFRLGPRGGQGYFGVQADLVTYGKTLGGGLPVGVLCGRRDLMKRHREEAPADVSLARGTFNSHPSVMGAMHEFLLRLESPAVKGIYAALEETWVRRAGLLNDRIREAGLPLRVVHLQSVFSVLYEVPSRYNWMLQFYLRAEGLEPGWTGTGRFIFPLSCTDEDFAEVVDRFVRAALRMEADGWWWRGPGLTNELIRREMLKDMLAARFPILRAWRTGLDAAAEGGPRAQEVG